MLNRIVRICPQPDPRHAELLAQAFDLDMSTIKPALTPGQKPKAEDILTEDQEHDSIESIVASIRAVRKSCSKVRFDDEIS